MENISLQNHEKSTTGVILVIITTMKTNSVTIYKVVREARQSKSLHDWFRSEDAKVNKYC